MSRRIGVQDVNGRVLQGELTVGSVGGRGKRGSHNWQI